MPVVAGGDAAGKQADALPCMCHRILLALIPFNQPLPLSFMLPIPSVPHYDGTISLVSGTLSPPRHLLCPHSLTHTQLKFRRCWRLVASRWTWCLTRADPSAVTATRRTGEAGSGRSSCVRACLAVRPCACLCARAMQRQGREKNALRAGAMSTPEGLRTTPSTRGWGIKWSPLLATPSLVKGALIDPVI